MKFLEKKSKEVQMGKMAQIKAGAKTLKDDKRWQVVNSRVVPILDQDYYTGQQLDEFMLAQRYAAAALYQM